MSFWGPADRGVLERLVERCTGGGLIVGAAPIVIQADITLGLRPFPATRRACRVTPNFVALWGSGGLSEVLGSVLRSARGVRFPRQSVVGTLMSKARDAAVVRSLNSCRRILPAAVLPDCQRPAGAGLLRA